MEGLTSWDLTDLRETPRAYGLETGFLSLQFSILERAHELQKLLPLLFEEVQGHAAQFDVVGGLAVRLVCRPDHVVLRFDQDGGFDVGLWGHGVTPRFKFQISKWRTVIRP